MVPAPLVGGQKRSLFVFDYLKYPDLCLAHFCWLMHLYWSRLIGTHLKLRKQSSTVHGVVVLQEMKGYG